MSVDSLISKGDCITNTRSTTSTASSADRGQEVINKRWTPVHMAPNASRHDAVIPVPPGIPHLYNGRLYYDGKVFSESKVVDSFPPPPPPLPPVLRTGFPVISTGQSNPQPPAAHSRPSNVHHQPPPLPLPPTHSHHSRHAHSHLLAPSPSSSESSSINSHANESIIHNSKSSTNGGSNSPHTKHQMNSKNSKESSDHKRHKLDNESSHVNNIARNGSGGVVRHSSSASIHDPKNLPSHLHLNHPQQQQQQQAGVNHSSKITSVVSSVSDASQFACAPFDSHSSGSGSGSGSASSSSSSSSTSQHSSSSLAASAAAAAAATAAVLAAQTNSANSIYMARLPEKPVDRLKAYVQAEVDQLTRRCSPSDHPNVYGVPPPTSTLIFPPGHPAYRPHPIPGLSPFPMVAPEPSGHCDTSSALPLTSKESTTRVLHSTAPNARLVAPALPNSTQLNTPAPSTNNKLASSSSSSSSSSSTPSTFVSSSSSTAVNKSQPLAKDSSVMNENSSEYLPQPPSSISPSNSTTSSNSSSSGGAKFHKKAWVQKYQDTAQDFSSSSSSTVNSSTLRVKENGTNSGNGHNASSLPSASPSAINVLKNSPTVHTDSVVSGDGSEKNAPSGNSSIGLCASSTAAAATAAAAAPAAATPSVTVKIESVDGDSKSKSLRRDDASSSESHMGKNCTASNMGKKGNSRTGSAKANDKDKSTGNSNKRLKKSQNQSDSDGDTKSASQEVDTGTSKASSGKRKKPTKEIDCDLTDEDTSVKCEEKSQPSKRKRPSSKNKKDCPAVDTNDEQKEDETADEDTCNGKSSSGKNGGNKSSNKSSGKQSKKSKDSSSSSPSSSSSSSEDKLTTGEVYLQDKSCSELGKSKGSAKQISRCIECNMTPKQKTKRDVPAGVFCRFYQFRKLVCNSPKGAKAAGFSEPKDAEEKDVSLWMQPSSNANDSVEILKVEDAKFLIELVGDHFCKLVEQEAFAMSLHMGSARMAWKSVVAGVREMCDVCVTTLFNIHWFCSDCGFVVCIDCYAARKELDSGTSSSSSSSSSSTVEVSSRNCTSSSTSRSSTSVSSVTKSTSANSNKSSSSGHLSSSLDSFVPKATDGHEKDKDKFGWLLCNSKEPHSQVNLVLTQIIARTALWDVCKRLHIVRREHLKQDCQCGMEPVVDALTAASSTLFALPETEATRDMAAVKGDSANVSSASSSSVSLDHPRTLSSSLAATSSPLSILADVAINAEKQTENTSTAIQAVSKNESICHENENTCIFTKLRLLLQNTTTALASNVFKSSGQVNSTCENSSANNQATTAAPAANPSKKGKGKKITLSSTQLNGVIKCDNNSNNGKADESTLKYFKRQIKPIFTSKNLPPRVCARDDTAKKFRHIQHSWYCDGKLLVLRDTGNLKNIELFQEQWIRHQVSFFSHPLSLSLPTFI